jgi:hypothetical protein
MAATASISTSPRNAGIAQLDLGASAGKVDLGFPTIAWDEDLIEIDMPQGRPCIRTQAVRPRW